jgi:threonine/homoserine/homoserine lactone efflux protein
MTIELPVWCLWIIPGAVLMALLAWSGSKESGYMGGFFQAIGCLLILAIMVTATVMYLIFAQ